MSRQRHIVFLNEFYHPDICASAAVLSDRLPRLRRLLSHDRLTVIAGNRAWDDPQRIYPDEEMHEGVRIVRVQRPPIGARGVMRRGLGFLAFGRNAAIAASGLGAIDLVIGTTAPPHGAGIARKIARAAGCPYVYTVLDLYPDLALSLERMSSWSPVYRTWMNFDRRWMRDARRVVCISRDISKRIIETRGFGAEHIETIHDGFDPAILGLANFAASSSEVQSDNDFRRRHNPNGQVVIQYAGNMGLSHPFETIMAACSRLAGDSRLQFQFIGGGPQREYVREHLPANGVLIDYQPADQLGELLTAADICLISQHEAMYDKALPYKTYGIFAAARPAIFVGNERSEIAEWLRESGAGVAVRQGDVDGLIESIRRLADDREVRSRMGASGRALLDERLHAEQSAARWAALIDVHCRS
ncbi:MAG: glycosyltransferase family 4 protein [Phycisphaerae bacterium]|nr:glycosyltransferase family 4 protein [Phycisphaerae bacterium]